MKFHITVYTNNPQFVLVKNESDRDYCYKSEVEFFVPKNSEVTQPTHLAKIFLGDWEKNGEYREMQERKRKRIDTFTLTVSYEKQKVEVKQETNEVFVSQVAESEFDGLEEVVEEPQQEEAKEVKKCKAITKAGKPCKANALEGSEYCMSHKK